MDTNKIVRIIGGPYNDHVIICPNYKEFITLTTFDAIIEENQIVKLLIEYGSLPNGKFGYFVFDERL